MGELVPIRASAGVTSPRLEPTVLHSWLPTREVFILTE
jgi:hypothetical protein